ncbi:hypothetical protein WDU99_09050 [Microbacterium sp. Mu-80]|uniref:Uncharacterized protein n=1 Tax=Microbacterium bandirmense TaxID=3122050 RepID=A0ABU8LAU7_9MICO
MATAVLALAVLSMSGCAMEMPDLFDPSSEPEQVAPEVTAAVEARTITDVLTLPMTVSAGLDYAVTASSRGQLSQDDQGRFFFTPTGTSEQAQVAIPTTATLAEAAVPFNVEVGVGTPLLTIHDTSLSVRAELTPAQVLRLAERVPASVRAQIEGSSAPFECGLNDPRPTASEESYVLSCRLPIEVPAVVGSTGLLALTLDERVDVPALPLEAVAGTRGQGQVYLSRDGAPHPVTLGITDGAFIEVTGGLAVGDVVFVPSPSILDG